MTSALQREDYTTRPCVLELVAIALASGGHVVLEHARSLAASRTYNAGACVVFGVYVVVRALRSPLVLRVWGLRVAPLARALRLQLALVAALGVALVALALARGAPLEPPTPAALLVYVARGLAQQFALQNPLVKNVDALVGSRAASAFLCSALFGAVHLPRADLAALAFPAGLVFTWSYRRAPSLLAVGAAHGLLGSLAFATSLVA